KHVAYAERWWFRVVWAGEGIDALHGSESFRLRADESTEAVIDFYRQECEGSRRVLRDAPSLDAIAQHHDHPVSLRWVGWHVVEETARHNGHADILRELTDGVTGI